MSLDILSHFSTIPDPRVERTKRYPLTELIFLVITGMLSGCDGWKSIVDFGEVKLDWLRQYLPYESGIPVDDTLARVMCRLDTAHFKSCFIGWMQAVCAISEGDVVAIDGKTLRGSQDGDIKSAIHMVSAWSNANQVVLGQEKTAEKSNEITAIPELLKALTVKGCLVTIDAMGCQTEIAKAITQKQADYVLAVKGNQGNLHQDMQDFFTSAHDAGFAHVRHDYHEDTDAGHGRIEYRQCWTVAANDYAQHFRHRNAWPKLTTLVMVKTRRELKHKTTHDTRYYISSAQETAETFLNSVRQHWGIENSLHWTLDVSFREDECRIRKGRSPENLAIIRHLVLNMIRKNTSIKASVKRKRAMAGWDDNVRSQLLCFNP